MILPTKRLGDRALLRLGADVLWLLVETKTISRLWNDLKRLPHHAADPASLTYDWFVLSLDFLFAIGAVDFDGARLSRVGQ